MITQIKKYLPEGFLWQDHLIGYKSIASTNDQAKLLVQQGAPHGTILIAEAQTCGRGRMGRSFVSPGGMGVYMSVILRLQTPPDQLMHLTCAAAVAACNALEKAVKFRPGIKWTNDLVYGGKKLAGILTELVITPKETAAIIGIGVNCCQMQEDFPEEIRDIAGSLSMVSGRSIDRPQVAAALIEAFYEMDRSLHSEKAGIMETYRRDCITVGKEISLIAAGEIRYGRALQIDDNGALIVEFSDGQIQPVSAGEVSIRGMYGYAD